MAVAPSLRARIDQGAAVVRDRFDQQGIDVHDRQVQAAVGSFARSLRRAALEPDPVDAMLLLAACFLQAVEP